MASSSVEENKSAILTLDKAIAEANSGWIFDILTFLSPTDAISYGSCCKQSKKTVNSNYLWSFYGSKYLGNVQSPCRREDFIKEAVSVLNFPDVKSLYRQTHNAKTSLIGWYRILPLSDDIAASTRGGLVCLRLGTSGVGCSREQIFLEIIDHSGTSIIVLRLGYCETNEKIVCFLDNKGVFSLEFDSRGRMQLKALSKNSGKDFLLQSLPRNIQHSNSKEPLSISSLSVVDRVSSILGLFVAPYGSHGKELIHLSLVENDERILEELDINNNSNDTKNGGGPFYIVNGLKITGDENVPATQLSFTADVTHVKDYYAWIINDERPIIFFGNTGIDILLISSREDNIKVAYQARGQTNKNPLVWEPEWVDCTIVVYVNPTLYNGAVFSVIWDDVGQNYRHSMDFLPFSGSNYPPIEPPLSWSSTNFTTY